MQNSALIFGNLYLFMDFQRAMSRQLKTFLSVEDLAHIVRRRGYKVVGELLQSSAQIDESNIKENPTTEVDTTDGCHEDETTGQNEKLQGLADHNHSSDKISLIDNYRSGTSTDPAIISEEQRSMSIGSTTTTLLQEKVAKFIQNGELESFEDDACGSVNQNGGKDRNEDLKNASEINSETITEELSANMSKKEEVTTSNGITPVVVQSSMEGNLVRDKDSHTGRQLSDDFDNYLDTEVKSILPFSILSPTPHDILTCKTLVQTQERENQVQINQLKLMLHQKELELSRLKEQIEKEKLALSILHTNAETEIGKAQKLISEKDSELLAAEESLSGLKEVQIQYCGDGESVEVSGSFNGWHHRIKLDPKSSSNIDAIESRKSRLWSTMLWLYPGVYEIKFIVDGQWRIDPQRESVTRGTINNNILRVDR